MVQTVIIGIVSSVVVRRVQSVNIVCSEQKLPWSHMKTSDSFCIWVWNTFFVFLVFFLWGDLLLLLDLFWTCSVTWHIVRLQHTVLEVVLRRTASQSLKWECIFLYSCNLSWPVIIPLPVQCQSTVKSKDSSFHPSSVSSFVCPHLSCWP